MEESAGIRHKSEGMRHESKVENEAFGRNKG